MNKLKINPLSVSAPPCLWVGNFCLTSILKLCIFVIFIYLTCACTSETPSTNWQTFPSRDNGNPLERIESYRAKVPSHWIRQDPSSTESIADTTKPNAAYQIGKSIYLTIYTFPAEKFSLRIPPGAQVARWKKQFQELDLTSLMVEPTAHAGFTGLYFYAEGKQKNQLTAVLGHAMQLAYPHWIKLNSLSGRHYPREMVIDYTIKAVGPPDDLLEYKEEITSFANSFELIHELLL